MTYPERKPDPLTEDTITLSDPSALSTYLSMGKSGEILPAIEISISGLGRQRLYSQILSSLVSLRSPCEIILLLRSSPLITKESSSILAASIVFEGLKTLVALDVEVYSFADKSVGLIIVGTIGMDYYLIKTTLEASVFADVNIDPHSSGASANAKSASRAFPFQATKPSVISHNAYSSRPLRITSYHKMQVCGARGVVLVLDNDGGAILLDVENNDEVEEEDGVVMDEDDEGGSEIG